MEEKKGQQPWTLYYHPKYSHHQAAAWEDRIQLPFFNWFPRRWWWPLSAVLSPTLQGAIKRTLNMLENIYCIDTTGIRANECLVPGSPGCSAFPRLGKFCVWPGQQLFVSGEFQDKKAEHFEGQVASHSGSQFNLYTYISHVPHLGNVRISLDLTLISFD